MNMTSFKLKSLESLVGHQFKKPEVLKQALTHASVERSSWNVYERLEFLGDRVLGLVIAQTLLHRFPEEREGQISRRYAQLVRRESLAIVAHKINFGNYLLISAGEEAAGARESITILSDALEAVIGALYLDGGLNAAEKFILEHWGPLLELDQEPPLDSKTALQEWAQRRQFDLPRYAVISQAGPAHSPKFIIEVSLGNFQPQRGSGTSKRQAEQMAAKLLFDHARRVSEC
ncbi:MAG: ribonuclease III [Rhodospirillaceae bacterium]|nr:ribonuclease III [Rhodospirillaceae bacterium]